MNTIESNKPTISFGIAFKKYKAKSGNYTHDMLSLQEELKMYKKIDKKLNRDDFVKTESGIKSKNLALWKDDSVEKSTALRYKDRTGQYFFDYNKVNLQGVGDAFNNLRAKFNEILNK